MALSQILPSRLRVLKEEVRRDLRDLVAAFRGARRPKSIQIKPQQAHPNTSAEAILRSSGHKGSALEVQTIHFAQSGQTLECLPGETILDAARRSELDISYSCTLGGCGACMLRVLQGEVSYEDENIICITDEERKSGFALACVGRPSGPIVVDA